MYERIPAWVRAFIPPTISIIALFVARYRSDITFFALIAFSSVLLFVLAYFSYKESQLSKRRHRQYKILKDLMKNVDDYDHDHLNGNTRNIIPNFEIRAKLVCEKLHDSIESYIHAYELTDRNISLTLFYLNNKNEFKSVKDQISTNSNVSRKSIYKNSLHINENLFISILWRDKNNIILSTSNTRKSEKKGHFKFYSKEERARIKSVVCYKILNSVTGNPEMIWAIASDSYNTFPDTDKDSDVEKVEVLKSIFSLFSRRLVIEKIVNENK